MSARRPWGFSQMLFAGVVISDITDLERSFVSLDEDGSVESYIIVEVH
jgi:hypothetical protein